MKKISIQLIVEFNKVILLLICFDELKELNFK